ncbi:MAG: DUF502 domain-containing protein [Gemmatimonadaceae bacterium]|nr:DUF502 domain-containing protein [Gemmatimonadaceae bacterium]
MTRLVAYFFRGLVLLAPLAVTIYVCVILFRAVDGWLGLPVPGAGFLATVLLITAVGFLGSNLLTRGAVSVFDRLLNRLPFVNLVYGSTRDLVKAFVGEKRRFDKPVLVPLLQGGHAYLLGFVTQESMARLGKTEFVSVYVPQSYHWAGQVYVFPSSAIRRLDASSAAVMAFIVSGGVTEIPIADAAAPVAPVAPAS